MSFDKHLLLIDFTVNAEDGSFVASGQMPVHGIFYYPQEVMPYVAEMFTRERVRLMRAQGILPRGLGVHVAFNGELMQRMDSWDE